MFPSKGNTVWVNFRENLYLGKVLQTSPELDMVCVRISNYMNHVTRESDKAEFVAHSCPESNPSTLSMRQSSVVITCGLADIRMIEPILRQVISKNEDIHTNSLNEDHSKSIFIPMKYDKKHESLVDSSDNGSKLSNSPDDDGHWSESFGISKLLRKTNSEASKQDVDNEKRWRCGHCRIYLANENNMCAHVFNTHKLEQIIDADNWVVLGGIKGIDYDEVKFQEDTNISSLDGIHISTGSSRKRQFLNSASMMGAKISTSNQVLENSTLSSAWLDTEAIPEKHFKEVVFCLLYRPDIYWQACSTLVDSNHLDLEHSERILSSTFPQQYFNELNNNSPESIVYNNNLQIFQNILFQHHINAKLNATFNNSLVNDEWPSRFRSNSIPDKLISLLNHVTSRVEYSDKDQGTLSPSKKTKLDGSVRKCRKVYGIDQRNLWCNQCKWKKACSRFASETHSN